MDKFAYFLVIFFVFISPPTLILSGFDLFDDKKNTFLSGFANHEFLNTIGFMMTIIVASLIQISLSLNLIEEKFNKKIFSSTRKSLEYHLFTVILLFIFGIFIVLIKPHFNFMKQYINGMCISIVTTYALSLLDVGRAALGIPSIITEAQKKTLPDE